MKIEMTKEFSSFLDKLENTNNCYFLTGNAGTGKSTLLKLFIDKTKKNYVVLSSTGISALNIGGMTVHSFFSFPAHSVINAFEVKGHKFSKQIKKVETIVIDEVSMIPCSLIDTIDQTLQKICNNFSPFGGKQIIFIGDLYQLPPIIKEAEVKQYYETVYNGNYHFFNAYVFDRFNLEILTLTKVFRQQNDNEFVNILNHFRNNTFTDKILEKLNNECFKNKNLKNPIYITTTNKLVDKINKRCVEELTGAEHTYYGNISGNFNIKNTPAPKKLILKIGCQIMILRNDVTNEPPLYVNGTIGIITDLQNDYIEIDNHIKLSKTKWHEIEYYTDKEGSLLKREIGHYEQYPIKIAYAVTIHKSQGQTFDEVMLDMGWGAFSPGQTYVALSRVTSLKGLQLKRPLTKNDFLYDNKLLESEF